MMLRINEVSCVYDNFGEFSKISARDKIRFTLR